ncbi:hypothetical protein BA895_21010 [Humibacillus sp. DSM 29435]|uniref:SRPBCC family protein n=1 Tax=Humibacillus sp. DSM 29435 TaxID=1869167 RepID=UPI000871F0D4|nr:SRPBCC family protein [Humibacillus sp. DSM 29435]OFE15987.1 hypothetical protein BA895_21010 [Humibacillus sp. DSM 29435]
MITSTSTSTAHIERLWSLVSDVGRWPEMLPTFTSVRALGPGVPGGPLELGSRFEVRQPALAKAVWTVTDCQPERRFTWVACSLGVATAATHEITTDGGGCRLELTLDWSGPLAPLVRRVYGARAARMLEVEANTFAHRAQSA